MRKSQREKLTDARKRYEDQVQMDLDSLLKLLVDGSRKPEERRLNPTQKEFIYDDTRMTAYMGPAGCAKTSTICAKAWIRGLTRPGNKTFMGRHDYNDLMGTTKGRMEEMLDRLPKGILVDREKSPPERWFIRPIPMPDPITGDLLTDLSTFTFMGMKDGLGSYEFHDGYVDEADEVEEKRIHELGHRLRAPGGWSYTIGLCFNPPDTNHWLYTACTGFDFQERHIREPWLKLYVPKPDENARNLPAGYYDDLAKHMPEDMKNRFIKGLWGATFPGSPVYKQFKQNLHVKEDLKHDGHSRMFRFWDFGYNRPCCIWGYVDWQGRVKILYSELGDKVEARAWARYCKGVSAQRFPGVQEWVDFGDPAIAQKKDTGSTLAEFAKEGILMYYRSSHIDPGLKAVRQRFELLIDGEPAIQINKIGNHILIRALGGGYRLDAKGEKPVKDGYYDHLCDALRYGIINLFPIGSDSNTGVGMAGNLPASIEYTEGNDHGN